MASWKKHTIAQFIPTVCEEIYKALEETHLCLPSTKEDWMKCEQETRRRWQFPNCLGAIDGKHIPILNPADSSEFFNYKGFFSIVLLAIVVMTTNFCLLMLAVRGE